MKQTLIQLFEDSVAQYGNNPFLWEKTTQRYEATTYLQTQSLVYRFGAGLQQLGIRKNDRVALLSEGRNKWVISELGILYCGATNVPLSIKLAPNELEFRLQHSEARMLIISSNQAPKLDAIKHRLPHLQFIIYLDTPEKCPDNAFTFDQILARGDQHLKAHKKQFLNGAFGILPGDYANISYTSGTTADPKGIILTHRNYTANVEQSLSLMDLPSHYRTLMILPMDHCFGHVAGIYSFMAAGASLGTVQVGKTPMETLKNIPTNIQELKPHILLSVPALAKNFRKNIERGIQAKGEKTWNFYRKALKTAYEINQEGYNKQTLKLVKRLQLWLYDQLLFKKIRQGFGGNLQFFIGGGALLDIELQRFYYAIGIPMWQGYGLSEATPVISSNSAKKHKLGSSGHLVSHLELKICNDHGESLPPGEKGEIVIKGENVMAGYWKNKEATRQTVRNGWLYTGDLGYMDADGFLNVLGRFKSLLIANDGEKYSPESIEEAITEQSEFIDQIMLHNNQNPYTVALLVPNKNALKRAIAGVDNKDQEALRLIQQELDHYRNLGKFAGQFPERWLPSALAVLPEPFSESNQMINSTMKMVRGKITEHYTETIDCLYTSECKSLHNQRNLESIQQWISDQDAQNP